MTSMKVVVRIDDQGNFLERIVDHYGDILGMMI